METPLRAIEMSDSSSLRINPSLAAEVHDLCVHACVCVSFGVLTFLPHLLCLCASG